MTKHDIMSKHAAGRTLDVGYAQEPNINIQNLYGIDIVVKPHPNYIRVDRADLNLCRLPYEDDFFDTVLMGCVLAHVTNPYGLLCEINRVLKEDGTLVVSSPNPQYYWEVALNVCYHFFKTRVSKVKHEEHLCSFSRFEMRNILARAGFSLDAEEGYLFALVKTPFRFSPVRFPGISYEIVYTAAKKRRPETFTILYEENGSFIGIDSSPTTF